MTPEQREWLKRPTVLPPCLRAIEGTQEWKFVEEYRISLPPPHFPLTLVIPKGWRYDRSSIPEYFVPAWLLDRDSLGTLAPAPHDAGYKCRGWFVPGQRDTPYLITPDSSALVRMTVTRAEVDLWFLLYLLRQRIPSWRAYAAYYAVRGWWAMREALELAKRW